MSFEESKRLLKSDVIRKEFNNYFSKGADSLEIYDEFFSNSCEESIY